MPSQNCRRIWHRGKCVSIRMDVDFLEVESYVVVIAVMMSATEQQRCEKKEQQRFVIHKKYDFHSKSNMMST